MSGTVLMLAYLCQPPAAPSRAMLCVAREVTASTCHEAAAITEAGLPPDRTWHMVACLAGPVFTPRPATTAPAPARRPAQGNSRP
ncbi:hypothetical protein EOD42_22250 [Rhodovarius crocodyli]|uniref:Uncharacterized protein n=1 Tax=Rhodovarius crocodyli TaxID=1979269 RepID=A0A437M0Y7_9PROT|nr:hypothetical protein [Rhodovarius crocodyli]RVT91379.1 hypothetical protein EOD42_22250 [Rhodovarius crocodyli]